MRKVIIIRRSLKTKIVPISRNKETVGKGVEVFLEIISADKKTAKTA